MKLMLLDKIYLIQSDDYTLTNSDIGSWVTVPFDDPVTAAPGTYVTLLFHAQLPP